MAPSYDKRKAAANGRSQVADNTKANNNASKNATQPSQLGNSRASQIPVPVQSTNNSNNNNLQQQQQPKKSNLKKPADKQGDPPVFKPEVVHAKQSTAMLAGQSLPNNSVQNLLVGRPGEHVAENVMHLFKEYYTDPAVMSRLPRQHQNDAMHRQLSSFQRIVDEMESHFSYSPSRFHAILLTLVNDSPQLKNMLKLGRLKDIFEERVSDAQKVTGYLRDTDKKTKQFFENFLTEILYHKRLHEYFCQRIYCPLYQYYYDEFDDLAETDDGYHDQLAALAKMNRIGMKRAKKERRHGHGDDAADGDLLMNKKHYMMGNYKAVNTWSEKRKLSYAVEHMFNLDQRWEALLDDNGSLDPDNFEPESSENMDQFNNYPAFEPILRLMPDLYVKARKAVELATLWWTAGNKLLPANPDQMVERAEALTRITEIRDRVDKLAEELSNADLRTIPYQRDLDALLARDDRFNRLAADYENLATLKREKLERHGKLEDRVNELESQNPYWSRRRAAKQQQYKQIEKQVALDMSEDLKRAREQMAKSYRHLRLVSYQFEITSGDYLAELTVRPTFVRFLDTCQQKLTSSENDIGDRRAQLARSQRELNALMKNYQRKREVLEKYIFSGEGETTRAGERNRDALEKHQSRLKAANNNNNGGRNQLRTISPTSGNRQGGKR